MTSPATIDRTDHYLSTPFHQLGEGHTIIRTIIRQPGLLHLVYIDSNTVSISADTHPYADTQPLRTHQHNLGRISRITAQTDELVTIEHVHGHSEVYISTTGEAWVATIPHADAPDTVHPITTTTN